MPAPVLNPAVVEGSPEKAMPCVNAPQREAGRRHFAGNNHGPAMFTSYNADSLVLSCSARLEHRCKRGGRCTEATVTRSQRWSPVLEPADQSKVALRGG